MNLSDLTESPQKIGPLDPKNIQDAITACKKGFDRAKKLDVIDTDANVALYELEEGRNGYFFIWEPSTNSVIYVMRYSTVCFDKKLGIAESARQILIWRSSNSVFVYGIWRKIFWDYLMPKYGVIVSDSEQTDDGARIWMGVAAKAFETGYTVRLMDTNDSTFIDMHTKAEFDMSKESAWGSSSFFRRKIFAVFKSELPK